jgi:hypothetical protein
MILHALRVQLRALTTALHVWLAILQRRIAVLRAAPSRL